MIRLSLLCLKLWAVTVEDVVIRLSLLCLKLWSVETGYSHSRGRSDSSLTALPEALVSHSGGRSGSSLTALPEAPFDPQRLKVLFVGNGRVARVTPRSRALLAEKSPHTLAL